MEEVEVGEDDQACHSTDLVVRQIDDFRLVKYLSVLSQILAVDMICI